MTTLEDAALALAMQNKVGFDADRSKRIGASEIGQCAKKIVGIKLGMKPDSDKPDVNGFAVRGNVMEDYWSAPLFREWIKSNGGELLYSGQANQVTFTGEGVPLSSTPDGLALGVNRKILARYGVKDIGKSKSLLTELKSLDDRVSVDSLPKGPHVPQVLTQIGMIRHATKHRPEWGVIAYVDASDYFKFSLHPVQWDEKKFKALVVRAKNLLACTSWDQVKPEGKINGGKECTLCPLVKQCLGFVPWLAGDDPRAPKPKQVAEVEKVAARLHQAKQAAAAAQQVVRDREADVYGVLNAVGRKFVAGKAFTVTARATASQERDDAAAMKAWIKKKGGDPEAFKKSTKPGTSITVEPRA